MHTPEQYRCDYHPNRVAVEKCERCGKKICLDCKRIRRVVRSESRGTREYTYCPACYQTVRKRSRVVGIIAFVVFIVIAIFMINAFMSR